MAMVSNTTKQLAALMVAGSFLVPQVSLALTPPVSRPVPDASTFKNVCSNLSTLRTTATARATERTATMQGTKSSVEGKLDVARSSRLTALTQLRAKLDAERKAHYVSLKARVSTTAQQAAADAFQAEVERLVTVRKSAVDVAIKAFEDGVSALRTKAGTAITGLNTKVTTNLSAIFDTAATSCTAGKANEVVVAEIKTGFMALKTAHEPERGQYAFRDQFIVLQKARLASTEAAAADFKVGMAAATAELKIAFTK